MHWQTNIVIDAAILSSTKYNENHSNKYSLQFNDKGGFITQLMMICK